MDWIRIEDQLPEEGQRVIYYFKETGIDIGRFTQAFFKGHKANTFYGNGWLTDDVTHWIPVPDPPDEIEWRCKREPLEEEVSMTK